MATGPSDAPPRVRWATDEGLDAAVLAAGPLEATFVPAAGLVASSLRHRGDELLDRRRGVRAYVATGATMGLPFLHPWANRLAGTQYRAAGREVRLPERAGVVGRDEHGLPIHGLLPDRWDVRALTAGAEVATLVARLTPTVDADRLAAFPFPHEVEHTITLGARALRIATSVRATGEVAVPIAFGFHPWLTLPGAPRAEWTLALPARRHLLTHGRSIPSGAAVREAAESAPLGGRFLDEGYDELGAEPRLAVAGGGRTVTVRSNAGYPVAQVFAPLVRDAVCLEPMTAPTNALVSGVGLRVVAPGERFDSAFTVEVA